MFYRFMQILMRLVLRVYFRKIYFAGAELIPQNKPVILACNHPNSFLDAILLSVLIKDPIHFLARSDVFNTPFKCWLLRQFNLIPIYRLQEGVENLHRNEETFAQCYGVLQNKGIILIFSEGICIQEKRLRPLKKGTARLAFGAEMVHNFSLNLQVVPVGINYTQPAKFRQESMISIGSPMAINKFKQIYLTQPARAMLAFNHELTSALQEQIIIIPEKKQEEILEKILARERANSKDFTDNTWLVLSKNWLEHEKKIVEEYLSHPKINTEPPIAISPTGKTKIISALKNQPNSNLIFLVLGFPVYITGFLLNIFPLWLAQLITRSKVRYIEFYSSVLMVIGLVLYLIYLLGLTILGFTYSFIIGILIFIMVPFLGYWALRYRDFWLKVQIFSI
jgi:glycerol-3-phosphate O-acyltransferase / dihydroxyacetone phosphate acyltransferase